MKWISIFLTAIGVVCPPSYGGAESTIVGAHNEIRKNHHLEEFKVNIRLSYAAQSHAEWMAENEKLTHTPNRKNTLSNRVNAENYRWSAIGENIAYGYPDIETVMDGWMKSTGHRENILNDNFVDIGIGVAYSNKGVPYYCVVFGKPQT